MTQICLGMVLPITTHRTHPLDKVHRPMALATVEAVARTERREISDAFLTDIRTHWILCYSVTLAQRLNELAASNADGLLGCVQSCLQLSI